MKHKFNNVPSLDWLYAAFGKHINQRTAFQVTKDFGYISLLEKSGFNPEEPIFVEAIFGGFHKRPRKRVPLDFAPTNTCEIQLVFRDVVFKQGDKSGWLFNVSRKENRRRECRFWYNEIHGGGVLTNQESFKPEQVKLLSDLATVSL